MIAKGLANFQNVILAFESLSLCLIFNGFSDHFCHIIDVYAFIVILKVHHE